jgi:glycosyltransferase involved in cell wall biosynthesis
MKLSVICPVYNEERTLKEIIARVQQAPLPQGMAREIIVVDDGSTDASMVILVPLAEAGKIKLVTQENAGKTAAVLNGFKHATGDVFIVQDGDLEYDPGQFMRLLTPIVEGKAQVVYGSRFMGTIKNMRKRIRLVNRITNWTINVIFGTKLTDNNTCYKVFRREVVENMVITSRQYGWDCEVTVKILKKKIPILEVPIDYVGRTRAEGKKIKFTTGFGSYLQIFRYAFAK